MNLLTKKQALDFYNQAVYQAVQWQCFDCDCADAGVSSDLPDRGAARGMFWIVSHLA
jgi:hypothetical protein